MARHRGGPLMMIALLLSAWGGARAWLWENPFAPSGDGAEVPFALPPVSIAPAALAPAYPAATTAVPAPAITGVLAPPPATAYATGVPALAMRSRPMALAGGGMVLPGAAYGWPGMGQRPGALDPRVAAGHRLLGYAALNDRVVPQAEGGYVMTADERAAPPPFLPPYPAGAARRAAAAGQSVQTQRWTADVWSFWRQGSDGTAISQGRVPIYGASQTGGILQFRALPSSPHDPRLYARVYRALVLGGESELALGASARPIGRVPLRLAAEARYTEGAFGRRVRPAGYAVTELAPLALPLGTQLEAYAQGGWVGGPGATYFADGQMSITHDVKGVSTLTDQALRLTLGAGAWGGAQKDTQRLDIGPTMRLDVILGRTPARVSVDWRERVAGDASPGSGLAATLSAQF